MSEYQFACPVCGQGIEINGPMRDAILSNGCPVCSAAVDDAAFECR
jgi:predicted nucleic acid-binding Zn ribbon protein